MHKANELSQLFARRILELSSGRCHDLVKDAENLGGEGYDRRFAGGI